MCNGSVITEGRTEDRGLSGLYDRSPGHPSEVWNLTGAVGSVSDLDGEHLDFRRTAALIDRCRAAPSPSPPCRNTAPGRPGRRVRKPLECRRPIAPPACRAGYVPPLLSSQVLDVSRGGWRSFRTGGSPPWFLPCSSARGEDAAVLRTFFSDRQSGVPLRHGVFFEIGGVDGLVESNTWVLESCFGWRGVLVEAHPAFFERLRRNRPASLNLRLTACGSTSTGRVRYTSVARTSAGVEEGARRGIEVECGLIGEHLMRLGVRQLDFASVDVEGSELQVVRSLLAAHISLGVLLVEVRADGQRRSIVEALLGSGMVYVGQLNARPGGANDVIDDCFANMTHLRRRFPRSNAARLRVAT